MELVHVTIFILVYVLKQSRIITFYLAAEKQHFCISAHLSKIYMCVKAKSHHNVVLAAGI